MNEDIISDYEDRVVQVTTPYTTGTGFFLHNPKWIVTNEHVIRGSKQVVIVSKTCERQMARVIFSDSVFDLAILDVKDCIENGCRLKEEALVGMGLDVYALGHPFGEAFSASQGMVTNTKFVVNHRVFIQHDAPLHPGKSGGPLINQSGEVVGVNSFLQQDERPVGYAIPVDKLIEVVDQLSSMIDYDSSAIRCNTCMQIILDPMDERAYCPMCGAEAAFISQWEDYHPHGMARTIEGLLQDLGYHTPLSRRGRNQWEVSRGSATITISYHEKSGLIVGESVLCRLPNEGSEKIYSFLLQQNANLRGLSFSIRSMEVVLSILIYDQFLNEETGKKLLSSLFHMSDYYDDILVKEWGGSWLPK